MIDQLLPKIDLRKNKRRRTSFKNNCKKLNGLIKKWRDKKLLKKWRSKEHKKSRERLRLSYYAKSKRNLSSKRSSKRSCKAQVSIQRANI